MTSPSDQGPNVEALLEWVHALESGDYDQASHGLAFRDSDTGKTSHCCLGVACDVFADRLGLERISLSRVSGRNSLGWRDDSVNYFDTLPKSIVELLGIGSYDPSLAEPGSLRHKPASRWNDQEEKTFTEIAAMIRHTFRLPDEEVPNDVQPT